MFNLKYIHFLIEKFTMMRQFSIRGATNPIYWSLYEKNQEKIRWYFSSIKKKNGENLGSEI